MAYTNKFILKADIQDLDSKLKAAEKSYTQAMDAMGDSTRQLTAAQKTYEATQAKTSEALQAQALRAKEVGVKAAKDEYAEKINLFKLEEQAASKEVTRLKRIEAARKRNVQLIKESIDATKAEITAKNNLSDKLQKSEKATKSFGKATQASAKNLKQISNDVVRHIRHLESYIVAIYAIKKGYDATLGAGHEFNKLIEQETIGLKLLISQNLEHVDLQGRSVTALQRYTYAQKEAAKAIELARQINVKTPHSFKETLQIFKLLTPQVLKYGGTLEQTAEITQRMSVVAASMGIEFQQFLKTVDSALSGEMKESGLKRALEQFGVTNEGIKEIKKRHGDVVGYVINGLQQAEAAGVDIFQGWSGTIGQFRNEWDDIWGQIQKPVFNLMKAEIKDYTLLLKDNKKEIVEVVKFIGEHTDDVLALGGAYLLSSKYLSVYTKTARASALATAMFGKNVTAMDLALARSRKAIVAIGASMKAMAASSGPMIALFAAFEAWSYYTELQNRQLEETKDILALTREELVKLTTAQSKQKKNTLLDQIGEVRLELAGVERDWLDVLTGTAASGPDAERTKELKAQEVAILAQLEAINKVTEADRTVAKELETQKQTRQELITEVSDLNKAVESLRNAELPGVIEKRKELEKQVEVKQKELDQSNENVRQLEETKRLLSGVGIGYKNAAEEAEDLAKATEKAAKAGLQLQQSLLQGQLARREISETDYIEQKFQAQWDQAEAIADMDKQSRAEIKAFDEYETAMYQMRTKEAQAIAGLELQLLEKNGTRAEKIAKKRAILISQGIEGRQLELSLQVYAQSLDEKSIKDRKKGLDDYLKGLQAAKDKLAEARLTTKEFQLRELGQELNELGEYLTQAQLAEIYDAELKKMEKSTLDFTDQFEGMLTALFAGDLSGAFEGFLNGMTTDLIQPFISETSDSLNASLKKLIGGGDLFGVTGLGSALLGGALSLLTTSLSSSVSQEEIDAAKGQADFSDESLRNLEGIFESAQYPMLQVTNKMYKHLRNMDTNFYSIARAIAGATATSGIDITGGSFVGGLYDGSAYSSKTRDLIGAGVVFKEQSLEALSNIEDIYVQGYESIKTTKEYAWKTSVTLATNKFDLPPDAVEGFADAFAEGYEAILTAGTTLGLDEADLTAALNEATIKLGDEEGKINLEGLDDQGVADALESMFGTAFSQVIDQVSDFDLLISRYTQNTEQSLETLIRIATEYDQASHMFGLIGKTFEDGVLNVTKTWTETQIISTDVANTLSLTGRTFAGALGSWVDPISTITETIVRTLSETTQEAYTAQMQMLDIVKSTGGLTEFQDAMGAFMGNFYTDAEQLAFMTKSVGVSFDTLGIAMPKTNDEFRTLLETMDTSTEEGAYLYGQVLLLAEGFNQMSQASDSLADSMAATVNTITDLYVGNLSYLSLQEKADLASRYFDLARQPDSGLNALEAARTNAEFALKTSATRAEYIPIFEQLVQVQKDQIEDASNRDLLSELTAIKKEVAKLNTTTTNAAIYGT